MPTVQEMLPPGMACAGCGQTDRPVTRLMGFRRSVLSRNLCEPCRADAATIPEDCHHGDTPQEA
jgi:hypothetical protein